jgi:hypothetical protein
MPTRLVLFFCFFLLGNVMATRWFRPWTMKDHLMATKCVYFSPLGNHLVVTKWFRPWIARDHLVPPNGFHLRLPRTTWWITLEN